MQLKTISLGLDGHYVACLNGNQGNDVSLAAMSLDELHSMIHESITDHERRHQADDVIDDFLDEVIQDAIVKLNTLHATFGCIAA